MQWFRPINFQNREISDNANQCTGVLAVSLSAVQGKAQLSGIALFGTMRYHDLCPHSSNNISGFGTQSATDALACCGATLMAILKLFLDFLCKRSLQRQDGGETVGNMSKVT